MESPRGITMLRCRKCRKGFVDSSCLYPILATNDSTASQCSVWHVNIDTMPVWILTSVQQAQWTVGKLNCQNCGARLGGFNFLHQSRCLCGQDATVHLSKSRMDPDYKHSVHVVQPRGTKPENGPACLQRRTELNRDSVFGPQLGFTFESCINVQTITNHAGPAHCLIDREVSQSCHFKTQCCIPHRKRVERNASASSSALSLPSIFSRTQVEVMTGTDQSPQPLWPCHPTQLFNDGIDPFTNSAACRSTVSRGRRSMLGQQQLSAAEDLVSSGSGTSQMVEVSDSAMFPRGSTTSHSIGEQQEDERMEALTSPEPNRLTKRERNRLKSRRRKQRKRERWMFNQQEQSSGGILTDGEEEDREGYVCAVCLDVYYSPYSCQPCGHVFCEPCLRTLARNRTSNTPCPLCRTTITHTLVEMELNQTIKTFFPKVYLGRKENFQKATCAKWPLPNSRRQRSPAPGRRWHYAGAGFTLDPLDIVFLAAIFFTYFLFS